MTKIDWTQLPEVRRPDDGPLFLTVSLPADVRKMLDDPARPPTIIRGAAYPQVKFIVDRSKAHAACQEAEAESTRLARELVAALGFNADVYAGWALRPERGMFKEKADSWWAALSARAQSRARDYVDASQRTRDAHKHESRIWQRVIHEFFAEADAAKQEQEDAAGYLVLDLPGEPGESLAEISKRTGRSEPYCRKALAVGIDAGAITIGERPGARGQTTKVYWSL